MKRTVTIIILLLAIAFRGFAQDTITGVVSRIDAPYFEQNVCDSRFAILAEGETYYVMVDNYWPNPYLEELVIHYDTISVGDEIAVVGNILEMEDGNGNVFKTINILQHLNAIYSFGIGYIDWSDQYATINCNVPPYNTCFIAINGELQTDNPIIFNGMTLDGGRYTMIGIAEIWPEYYLPVLEITQVIPYTIEKTVDGVVVANEQLCLTTPYNEKKYLSWSDNNGAHYLTNKDKLHDENFFSAIWDDNIYSTIKGFGTVHYDLFGAAFNTFEILQLETKSERSISGQIRIATDPPTGPYPPITQRLAIRYNGYNYYIENQQGWNENFCFIDNDTLPMYSDVTALFSTSYLFLGGSEPTPYCKIHIDDIEISTSNIEDVVACVFSIYINLSIGIIEVNSMQQIKSIAVYDTTGQKLINKTCNSKQSSLPLNKYRGLAIIQVVFENGQTASRKVVVL